MAVRGGAEKRSLLEQVGAAGDEGRGKVSASASSLSCGGRTPWHRTRPFATASATLGLLGLVFATLAVGTRGRGGDISGGLRSLDLSQPYLGALDCAGAFRVPKEGPSDRFSYTFVRLISFADFIYVLCVDCDKVTVPSLWRGKVRLVDGKKIDACVQDYNVDHWHRATFSHAVAIAHARTNHHNKVAIVEDDSRSDYTVNFSDSDYEEFKAVLANPAKWNFIRLGWRPYGMETNAQTGPNGGCPEQCKCVSTGARTCALQGPGCDLRSSDAYFITRGAYNDFIHRLKLGVVDFDVLQSFDKMMLVTPMLSYQEKLDISMESQRALQAMFKTKCVHGPIIDNVMGGRNGGGLTAPRKLSVRG